MRTGLESQNVDIWGNAMAGAMGFASRAQDERMFAYFEANEKAIQDIIARYKVEVEGINAE